jgi:hypothetical protein
MQKTMKQQDESPPVSATNLHQVQPTIDEEEEEQDTKRELIAKPSLHMLNEHHITAK